MSANAVAYTVTGTHITLLATSLYALITTYTAPETLDVLILSADSYETDLRFLQAMPEKLGKPQITVKLFGPPDVIATIPYHNERYPQIVLWRLFIPSYFPDYQRILYLDNDTLIYQSIDEMFDLVPSDKAFAGVRDFFIYSQALMDHQPDDWRASYINAGMVLFNVPVFNRLLPPERFITALSQYKLALPDQDLLNRLGAGHITFLPFRYNDQKSDQWLNHFAQVNVPQMATEILAERQHLVIRHFIEYAVRSMPWQHLALDDQFEVDFWRTLTAMKQLEAEWSGFEK